MDYLIFQFIAWNKTENDKLAEKSVKYWYAKITSSDIFNTRNEQSVDVMIDSFVW